MFFFLRYRRWRNCDPSVTQRATQLNEESSSNIILTVEKSRLLLSSMFIPKRKPRYWIMQVKTILISNNFDSRMYIILAKYGEFLIITYSSTLYIVRTQLWLVQKYQVKYFYIKFALCSSDLKFKSLFTFSFSVHLLTSSN